MENPNEVLLDSYRFPEWVRIPAWGVGIFFVWAGLSVGARGYLKLNLGFPITIPGAPLVGMTICLLVAAALIFAGLGYRKVVYDSLRHDVVFRYGGFLKENERRVKLSDAQEIRVRSMHGGFMRGMRWHFSVAYGDGTRVRLMEFPAGANDFAEKLGAATGLAVKLPEDAGSPVIS